MRKGHQLRILSDISTMNEVPLLKSKESIKKFRKSTYKSCRERWRKGLSTLRQTKKRYTATIDGIKYVPPIIHSLPNAALLRHKDRFENILARSEDYFPPILLAA